MVGIMIGITGRGNHRPSGRHPSLSSRRTPQINQIKGQPSGGKRQAVAR